MIFNYGGTVKLKRLIIKNFRGYKNETSIDFEENLTGIIGRNDVGKSSILEALDIFFEGGEISIEKDDFFIGSTSSEDLNLCRF